MYKIKKILSFLLTLCMLFQLFPWVPANAASGSDFTDNAILSKRLDKLFKDYPPNASFFKSTPGGYDRNGDNRTPCNRVGYGDHYTGDMSTCGRFDGSYQCHAYAYYAQYVLFGKTQNGKTDSAVEGAKDIRYTTVRNPSKSEILRMPFGTHIKNDYPAHSVILLSCDENHINYIDANCADGWGCAVHLHQTDWNFFYSRIGIGASSVGGTAVYPTAESYPVPAPEPKPYGQTPFIDIGDHWARDYIESAYLQNIASGDSDRTFSPQGEMTRGMFVQMLYNLYGKAQEGDFTQSSYTDVPGDAWYRKAVSWAEQYGVVTGIGDGLFAPNRFVTRQEAMQIFYNYNLKLHAPTIPEVPEVPEVPEMPETPEMPEESLPENPPLPSENSVEDLPSEPESLSEQPASPEVVSSVSQGSFPEAMEEDTAMQQETRTEALEARFISTESPEAQVLPAGISEIQTVQTEVPETQSDPFVEDPPISLSEDTDNPSDQSENPPVSPPENMVDFPDPPPYPIEALNAFEDQAQVSEWARSAMAWSIDHGIISGRSPTKLAPLDTITRGEAATVFVKLVKSGVLADLTNE